MKIRMRKNKIYCIHIDDEDEYEVKDDNGVDFFPTRNQIAQIIQKGAL